MASTRTQLRSQRVLPADPGRKAGSIAGLALDGRSVDMQIGDRLLDATLERTIEAPNTLTLEVWDQDATVLSSGVLGDRVMSKKARIEIDGLGYIAADTSRTDGILSIDFEDEPFVILKRHGIGKPISTARDSDHACAGFCAQMIRSAGVPVIVLDEHVVQPIKDAAALKTELAKARGEAAESGRSKVSGVKGAGLTVKGAAATAEQRRNIGTELGVAADEDAPELAILAMLCAGTGESAHKAVPNSEGAAQTGVFQGPSGIFSVNDTAPQARSFLRGGKGFQQGGAIKLARENPGMSAPEIATRVEAGGEPASFYDYVDEAKAWMNAGVTGVIAAGSAWEKDYAFERRKKESTYAACYRLLVDERKWRLFAREGVVIIASDPALMRARSSLTLTEGSDAVLGFIDFDWPRAAHVGEADGQFYVRRYQADPGETVDVAALPQAQRKWLLASTKVSLRDEELLGSFTLCTPQKPLDEPQNEIETSTGGDAASSLYAACAAISNKHLPYVWGGGHAHAGTPDGGDGSDQGIGYDCSGAVGAALAAVGWGFKIGDPIPGSSSLETWGEPGRGETHTVWSSADHTFIELTGVDAKAFDTRRTDGGDRGPRLRSVLGSTAGFTPRHWKGA